MDAVATSPRTARQLRVQGDRRVRLLPRERHVGRRVHALTRRPSSTHILCVVATPEQPTFRYRLRERWLAALAPPPPPPPASAAV
jgi:hypothetical protein